MQLETETNNKDNNNVLLYDKYEVIASETVTIHSD